MRKSRTARKMKKTNEMKYEYREVKCPWCGHIFMWNKHGQEGLVFHEYRLKETGEYVEQAVCPKCELDMVVLEHIFEGVDKKDDRIEDTTVRGL